MHKGMQQMVDARAAGVVFTADPLSGRRSRIIVDAVRGKGEALVSGLAQVKTNLDSGMFGAVQRAAAAALSGSQECVREMCRVYQRRRDLLAGEALRRAGGGRIRRQVRGGDRASRAAPSLWLV